MATMMGRIACLIAQDYEDLEVWYPRMRMQEAGFEVPLFGTGETFVTGKHGYPANVDFHIDDLRLTYFDGIIVPGGWAPDKLRRDQKVLQLIRDFHEAKKMIATICHGPWVLISAGIVKGRRMTSSHGIKDDLMNAGAEWVDEATATDGHIVTARAVKDLPHFGAAMMAAIGWEYNGFRREKERAASK
jgi:protease I